MSAGGRASVEFAHQTKGGVGGAGRVYGTAYSVGVPPLEAYDAWWRARPEGMRRRDRFSPARYRRMAIMLTNGDGMADIARAQGVSIATARTAMERLPKALGGQGEE